MRRRVLLLAGLMLSAGGCTLIADIDRFTFIDGGPGAGGGSGTDGGAVSGPGPCGDGVLNSGESCDDGNTANGDGCSSTCQCEATNLAPIANASSGNGTAEVGTAAYGAAIMQNGKGEADNDCEYHWLRTVTSGAQPEHAWIEYDWTAPKTIGFVRIDTNATTKVPCGSVDPGRTLGGGVIEFWSNGAWVTGTQISGKLDDWTYTFPTPIVTTKIRIRDLVAAGTVNDYVNIYEWKVSCAPIP